MSRILVTGGAGFIGSALVRALRDRGDEVTTWDLADGCDIRELRPWQVEPYDAIVHLAGQVSVADSMKAPLYFIEHNTVGTARLLAALVGSARLRRLVVASSASVYGEPSGPLAHETSPCVPVSVYGQTKYDTERLSLMWGQQHDVPTAALRFFNIYGPGMKPQGALGALASQILAGKPVNIFDDGTQTRDFVYIDDAVAAILAALDSDAVGALNVASGIATTIHDAAASLAAALGEDAVLNITHQHRPGDVAHLVGSTMRTFNTLHWHAATSLDLGLEKTAKWLKESSAYSSLAAPAS